MEFNATFLVSAISFILFVFLMNKIFYAPLEKIIYEREKLVDDTLNEAKKSREMATGLLEERERKLNKAFDDSKKIINDGVLKANKTSKELTSNAKNDSINEINIQKEKLDAQSGKIREELESSSKEIAEQIISKILG